MFENSNNIQLLSVPRQPRRYLILIRAGSKPRPSFFSEIPDERREYDLAVNYYATPHPDDILRNTAEIVFAGGLSKMHGAKQLFETTELHNIYEGVFFLDDDIEISFDPDKFFEFCNEYSLDLAQPALTPDCIDAIGLTRQHPGLKLRTTNWVEVMAPFFRRNFLKEMLHSFDLSISGWGLDLYWGHHLTNRWTAGIVDEFLMRHTQVSNHDTGAFYSYLRSIGVNPYEEMRSILNMLGTNRYTAKPIRFVYHTYSFGA
ncbi:hypothetical protein [Mesorhizobium sp. B4-1-4]|uniref:hypothetical protein n=1 Tax=Mesorhizobium sp. B4-1-4 TaxID=2589888 RepID=UPI00112A08D8|nr:hypothetical protein [Mesorhizobium sp. B4-1-4]UCI29386.1 hypothetical protein FJW03_16090 [Mesorhizobium sp. B4-1-4]